jgi:hypothetical protein
MTLKFEYFSNLSPVIIKRPETQLGKKFHATVPLMCCDCSFRMYDDYLRVEELGLGGRWGKSGDVVVFPEQLKINRSEHRQNRYTKKTIGSPPHSLRLPILMGWWNFCLS